MISIPTASNKSAKLPTDDNAVNSLQSDKKALEDFLVDNSELEELEARLDQFNIFEAVNIVRQELKHSAFLGFLLDPRQPHGLSDTFLKKLLQKTLVAARDTHELPVSLVDIDIWSLTDSQVFREWNNIDILLINSTHRLAVLIENKVDANEHGEQLSRYLKTVRSHYPDYKIVPIFLTPQGQLPTEEMYVPLDYFRIVSLLETVIETRGTSLGEDITILIRHYIRMVRRQILNQNELEELCRRVYAKHQRALDLIFEQKPDNQVDAIDRLKERISQSSLFEMDYRSARQVTFTVPAWDILMPPDGGMTNWSAKGRVSRFEFWFEGDTLRLFMVIGPGDEASRQKLFDVVRKHRPPFTATSKLSKLYSRVYNMLFLTKDEWQSSGPEEMRQLIDKKWDEFVQKTWPDLDEYVTNGLTPSTVPPDSGTKAIS